MAHMPRVVEACIRRFQAGVSAGLALLVSVVCLSRRAEAVAARMSGGARTIWTRLIAPSSLQGEAAKRPRRGSRESQRLVAPSVVDLCADYIA
eukprot:6111462-Alexandrium_andersonii.AAC.1